ncbi:hypothetical protein ACE6H2_021175 [Prunus campanulata]
MVWATALSISLQKIDGTENGNKNSRGEFRNMVVVGFVAKGSDEAARKVPCIHKPIHDKITTTRVLHTLGAITRTLPTPSQLSKLL